MNKILEFVPKSKLSSRQNLESFIDFAREKLTLWSDIPDFDWCEIFWPTKHKKIRFIRYEHSSLQSSKLPQAHHLMHPEFMEFSKAFLRYTHTTSPHKNVGRDVRVLRIIEHVLRQEMDTPDITYFEQRHWNAALKVIDGMTTRQILCNVLLNILKTLSDLLIIKFSPTFWKNPYVGKDSYDAIRGANAPAEVKQKKIADQDALLAIADVFSRGEKTPLEDTDVMVTSITSILLSAPMRIGETLRLRPDCLREEKDKNGEVQHYLALWIPKTREFARKPVPKTMVSILQEAIKRLTDITEDGRVLARYMENNPSRFYRHANCPNVTDDQILTVEQVVQALGFEERKNCDYFIKRHTGNMSFKRLTLNSLWQMVLAEHKIVNPHFPYQEAPEESTIPPLKMSESLLCFRRLQLSHRCFTNPLLLQPFDKGAYGKRLVPGDEKQTSMNFFSRHGYDSLQLKSHGVRHWVNQLARQSGVGIELLTDWSNRATIRQTRNYIHDAPQVAAAKGARLLETIQVQEPKAPITDNQASLYAHGPIHRSRYGLCRRSWRAGPCNKFADCLNCSELLMCKGDKIAAEIIASDRNHLVQTYNAAQSAISNGERAASRWTEMAEGQIVRLNQLLAILNDPLIPDGSPVEMIGEDFSHEKTIISEKAQKLEVRLLDKEELGITYGEEILACLELLRSSEDV